MTTIYQQLCKHLELHGCHYHCDDVEEVGKVVWKNADGMEFYLAIYIDSREVVDLICRGAGVPPMKVHTH